MIVTSRTGEFRYNIDNTEEYELCSLTLEQVGTFAARWLKDESKAHAFVEKVSNSPFADTAIRPLTLAHLCAICERIRDIPDKPKTVYRKIVNLLLEEWDQQRGVQRTSRYAAFEVDRKYEFLCHLAYKLTVSEEKTVFSSQNLIHVYRTIYQEHGLLPGEAKQVAAELESHNGLLLQTGYDLYEFAHKSIQEFLTAEFLVKLPFTPFFGGMASLPNELAIAVAISSSPSLYLADLILRVFRNSRLELEFLRTFISRLALERPTFKADVTFELALLSLFTNYVEIDVIRRSQLHSFRLDPVLRTLEDLIVTNFGRDVAKVLTSYETVHMYEMPNGDHIQRLVLNKNLIPARLPINKNNLPDHLMVRNSLLSPPRSKKERFESQAVES